MTDEPQYTEPAPFPEAGYVSFQIPGMPYSVVRLPLVWSIEEFNVLAAQAMESAKIVKEAYDEAFPERFTPVETGVAGSTPQAQQRPAQPRQQTPRAQSDGLDPDLIITGFCPDHPRSKALPSIAKYQEIEFDEEGNEKYSKYFCSGKDNGTGKNHSLWRRQVIPAEPF